MIQDFPVRDVTTPLKVFSLQIKGLLPLYYSTFT